MKISSRDYDVTIHWSEVDQVYLAKVAELPGIMADEPTRAEAARQMEEALELALATAEELGPNIARAKPSLPSGLTALACCHARWTLLSPS